MSSWGILEDIQIINHMWRVREENIYKKIKKKRLSRNQEGVYKKIALLEEVNEGIGKLSEKR